MHLGASTSNSIEGAKNLVLLCEGFLKCTKNSCYYDIHTPIFSLMVYTQINIELCIYFDQIVPLCFRHHAYRDKGGLIYVRNTFW